MEFSTVTLVFVVLLILIITISVIIGYLTHKREDLIKKD